MFSRFLGDLLFHQRAFQDFLVTCFFVSERSKISWRPVFLSASVPRFLGDLLFRQRAFQDFLVTCFFVSERSKISWRPVFSSANASRFLYDLLFRQRTLQDFLAGFFFIFGLSKISWWLKPLYGCFAMTFLVVSIFLSAYNTTSFITSFCTAEIKVSIKSKSI